MGGRAAGHRGGAHGSELMRMKEEEIMVREEERNGEGRRKRKWLNLNGGKKYVGHLQQKRKQG